MPTSDFDRQILDPLRRQRHRLRWLRALDGASITLGIAVLVLALHLLLDWWLRLRLDMRAALMLLAAAVCGRALWRHMIVPLRLRFGSRELALALERRHPELGTLLISAVDFSAGRVGATAHNSPELVRAVVDDATRAVEKIQIENIVFWRRKRRTLGRVGAVLVVTLVGLAAAPQTLGIWFERNVLLRDVAWPQRTRLVVDAPADGVIRGAVGDDLEIRAHVADGYQVPRQVELILEADSGATGRETMTGVGDRGFRLVFPRVREGFRFHLAGGDDVTDAFTVRLSARPIIESAEMTIEPPAYTGLSRQVLPDGQRAAEVYRGSSLTIRATASKDLTSAELRSGSAPAQRLDAAERTLVAEIRPEESQTYHFELVDQDGLNNSRPARFSVRILEDDPPKVRMAAPNVGNLVTAQAVLPLEMAFADELGLADAALVYAHSGASGEAVARPVLDFVPGLRSFEARLDWPIVQAGAAVGDAVTLTARARDFNDVNGPGIGESTTMSVRIATSEELAAEFRRREQEYRRQFERLVDSQERLRRRLLSLAAEIVSGQAPANIESELAPLERQQRQIRQQVGVVHQQFAQVLAEMEINRMDDAATRRRMHDGIIAPLDELAARDLSDAADHLRRLGREGTAELARAVDPAQAAIGEKMRRVLDNMLQWEGFQETVGMLREILQLQRELNAETRQSQQRRGSDFFDD